MVKNILTIIKGFCLGRTANDVSGGHNIQFFAIFLTHLGLHCAHGDAGQFQIDTGMKQKVAVSCRKGLAYRRLSSIEQNWIARIGGRPLHLVQVPRIEIFPLERSGLVAAGPYELGDIYPLFPIDIELVMAQCRYAEEVLLTRIPSADDIYACTPLG